jgi:hypothetical protein
MKLEKILFTLFLFFVLNSNGSTVLLSQEKPVVAANFKETVENRLKTSYRTTLNKICPVETDATARRIFKEYGAIFVSKGAMLPGKCIFTSDAEVQSFQSKSNPQTAILNGVQITLQKAAMDALLKANAEALKKKLRITPRGGSIAASRSFEDTVRLWNSRFFPALNYWVGKRKITKTQADAARVSGIREQVAQVLEWENNGWFFSKDLTKSILFSVAAPGASQHNFMLALDVEQFANKEIRQILADHGWFQTIKSDLPHFTYLGVKADELPALGLKETPAGTQKFWIPNVDL